MWMTREIQRAIKEKRRIYETYKSAGSVQQELVQKPIVKEKCKKMTQKAKPGKEDRKSCEHNKRFYKFGI